MATLKEQTLIRNLYPRLRDLADKQFNNPVEAVYALELEKEREHRRLAPSDWKAKNFNLSDAAKYFTLQHVFKGMGSSYSIESLLNVRLGAVYGQAIANEYRARIVNEFTQVEIVELLALDYQKMME